MTPEVYWTCTSWNFHSVTLFLTGQRSYIKCNQVLLERIFISLCTSLPPYHTCWQTKMVSITSKQANEEKGEGLVMSCLVYFWFIVFSTPKHGVCCSQAPPGGQRKGHLHLALELHWLSVHRHYSGLHWGRPLLYSWEISQTNKRLRLAPAYYLLCVELKGHLFFCSDWLEGISAHSSIQELPDWRVPWRFPTVWHGHFSAHVGRAAQTPGEPKSSHW